MESHADAVTCEWCKEQLKYPCTSQAEATSCWAHAKKAGRYLLEPPLTVRQGEELAIVHDGAGAIEDVYVTKSSKPWTLTKTLSMFAVLVTNALFLLSMCTATEMSKTIERQRTEIQRLQQTCSPEP